MVMMGGYPYFGHGFHLEIYGKILQTVMTLSMIPYEKITEDEATVQKIENFTRKM